MTQHHQRLRRTGFAWDERFMWHNPGKGGGLIEAGGWIEPYEHNEHPDAKRRVKEIIPEEVKKRLDADSALLLVDTREDNEWEKGRIAGSLHLGKGIIERDIEQAIPDKNAEIILYCGGGFRSALSADNLQKMGYTNIVSMDGGWRRWKELGYPAEQ